MAAEFEFIDVHVHVSEDPEMEKILYPKKGWPDAWYWASTDRVERYMDFHGISHMVAVNLMNQRRLAPEFARFRKAQGCPVEEPPRVPTDEEARELVRHFNRWVCSVARAKPRLIQFVATEPVLFGEGLLDEIEECVRLGARGLKVHPRNCRHRPDTPTMYPVYAFCQERGLPILADTGGQEQNGMPPLTEPALWIPVLQKFPRLKLIMAHFCGEYWEERVEMAQQFRGDNLVFDLAGGLVDERHPPAGHREMLASQAPRLFRKVGVDRILFGSDGPHGDPVDGARQVLALDLSDDEKERILSRNARGYLGL